MASVETKKPLNNNAVAHITSYHDEIFAYRPISCTRPRRYYFKAGMNSGSEVLLQEIYTYLWHGSW